MPPLKLSEIREVITTAGANNKIHDNEEDKELKKKINLLTERRIKTPGYISLRNLDNQ